MSIRSANSDFRCHGTHDVNALLGFKIHEKSNSRDYRTVLSIESDNGLGSAPRRDPECAEHDSKYHRWRKTHMNN